MLNKSTAISLARSARITAVRNFAGGNAEERAYRLAQWFLAGPLARLHGETPLTKRAEQFCREQGLQIDRAHSAGENETGGFLVPQEFSADFVDLRERYGVFRRNARVSPMLSEAQHSLRRKGGLKAYPVGSGEAITESEARWDGIYLEARKWGVLSKFEAELSEDALTNFGDELAGEMAKAFAFSEDECGFLGDGSPRFHGIYGVTVRLRELDEDVANVAGLVEASGDTWAEISRADMTAVLERLPEYADTEDTRWSCSRKFWANVMVRLMLEAGGRSSDEIMGQRYKSFMGYPVEIAQVLPRKSEAGSIPCLFGDLRQAARFGDRRQMAVSVTDSNRTEFQEDLITIKGTQRFDINVHSVGNASADEEEREAGPVVGLITMES